MAKNTLFCIFLIINTIAYGQLPLSLSFHHLTREDGLSNNNVFYLYRDSRGFLWLGTTNGLNRFDGLHVKTYTTSNSKLKGAIIFNMVEDKAGNLWVGCDNELYQYNRSTDQFVFIPPPSLQKATASFPYAVDDKNRLWVIFRNAQKSGLYIYDPVLKKYAFVTDEVPDHISARQITPFQPIKTIYCSNNTNTGLNKLTLESDKVTRIETFFTGKNGQPALSNIQEYIEVENDSTIWLTNNNLGLIRFNPLKNTFQSFDRFNNRKIKPLSKVVSYKNMLIAGSYEGLYIFDKVRKQFTQNIRRSLYNPTSLMANSVEVPYVDDSGNLFVSQPGFGVDYTNLDRIITEQWLSLDQTSEIGLPDNHITHIVQRGSQVWTKFQHGGTVAVDSTGKILYKYDGAFPLLNDSQNRLWLLKEDRLLITHPEKNSRKVLHFQGLYAKTGWQAALFELNKTQYLLSGEKGLFIVNASENTLEEITAFNKENTASNSPVLYDKTSDQIFVSANWWSTFYALERKSGIWKIRKKVNFPFRTFAIRPAKNHLKVWLGTSSGLVLMDKQTFEYTMLSEKEGIPDNTVTDITEEENGNYWLVTNLGISYYDAQKKEFRNFTSKDGAYSHEYDWNCAFRLPDKRMVFGGTSGLTVINSENMNHHVVKPRIQITRLYANEKPVENTYYIGETRAIELKPEQNSFALELKGIEYGFPQKVRIHYQLTGYDQQWIVSGNPATARYTNVSDGAYKFVVKATDEDGMTSSEIRTLTIFVHAPFYRTTWFRTLLLAGFAGLGYLLYRLRIKQIQNNARKREEIKRIRAEAEINALRSQMNPHFIFNCLNTIDSYILLNKTDEASEFLNKFSKLIRRILENSRQEFIPIEQDIQALELYIRLEQERSHPKFRYEIIKDDKILKNEYYIPSMLIQPFVENAILHGLRHKRSKDGKLILDIKITEDQIFIQIKDNGIGREASAKLNSGKKTDKNSVGIQLTRERMQRLDDIYPGKISLDVIDIYDNKTTGTIIEIKLPLLTHENIVS